MRAVFKNEFKGYFISPVGYVFIGVFVLLNSFMFVNGPIAFAKADVRYLFSNINVIAMFLIALLTMRLWAEERSRQTDRLLITSPVRVGELVMGKYLAAMCVFGVTLLISCAYPIVLFMYGEPSFAECVGGLLGFVLMWGALVAVGFLISSLTKSSTVAAAASMAALILISFTDSMAASVGSGAAAKLIRAVSLFNRYESFEAGMINIADAVFFISVIFLLLFLTAQIVGGLNGHMKKGVQKLNTAVKTAAVVICVVLVNVIMSAVSEKLPMKIDITKDGIYSFSEQTESILGSLDKDVEIYAAYTNSMNSEYDGYVREYLEKYAALSDKVKVKYVDIYANPASVRQFEKDGSSVTERSVIASCGERYKVLSFADIYSQNQYDYTVSIDMESKLTSAIATVTSKDETKIMFTEGHGEYECALLESAFEGAGYDCSHARLSDENSLQEASILVIADPTADFTEPETEVIDSFADGGGQIMYFGSPGDTIPERLAAYLSDWGVVFNDDYIVENDKGYLFRTSDGIYAPAPIIAKSEITDSIISRKLSYVAPISRSLELKKSNAYNTFFTKLLTTTKNSWGKRNYGAGASANKEDGDTEGPLTIAAIAERGDGARLLALGSLASLESAELMSQSSYANSDFILNAVAYMTGASDTIGIRAKQISAGELAMTKRRTEVVTAVLLYLIPGLIFAAGIVVWLRRRYR